MATLEKIRSKSVFLIVIIAVALLAFILGDLITNWGHLFGNNTTVASVGGDKIEITDYQRKHNELSQQLEQARQRNPQQVANFDNQLLSQMAIEQLIDEHLVNKAVGELKLKPSGEILKFYMIEHPEMLPQDLQNKLLPSYQQLLMSMAQSGLPVQGPEDAYKIIFNPASVKLTEQQVGPYKRAWLALEEEFSNGIAQVMYFDFLGSSFKANKLDAAAVKKDYAAMANVKVAKKPYENIDEKKYAVSDDEIKKAYEANKSRYAVDDVTKEISFIAVTVNPSAADVAAANQLAAQVASEMKKGNNLSKNLREEGITVVNRQMKLEDIRKNNPQLATYLESATIDSVATIKQNMTGFEIAKLTGRNSEIDSIDVATVMITDASITDEVVNALNNGANPDSVANKYEAGKVMPNPSQNFALYDQSGKVDLGLSAERQDSLINAHGKYVLIDEMQEGVVYGAVTNSSSPTQILSYELVTYDLHPSEATVDQAYTQLTDFLQTNNTAAKFVANATKNGYYPESVELTASNPAIPAGGSNRLYPDSRPVVRWALMDGKKGEVSKVFQSRDLEHPMLYAAAIIDSYEDYKPWNNQKVKDELTTEVRNSKAGDDMVKQYSGKGNIDATAQAMGVEPREIQQLRANRYTGVPDAKVLGKIMGSKPSQKVVVVKGDDGVYAYVINSMTEEQLGDNINFDDMFLQMHRVNPNKILRGAKKVENNIYKFEQGE